LEKDLTNARTGGAKVKLFFQRKTCNNEVGIKVIRIKLTFVVSKQSSERTMRRTNVGVKQQWPFSRTGKKCQASNNRFSKYSFSMFFHFDFGSRVDTRFKNSYGRHCRFFGTLRG
tara:strand:- start:228 stop:572 length:345 start_codon:yes stop_codon:yes gene_type:complete